MSDVQTRNKLLEQFKKTKTFKIFYSTLLKFDEDLDCFVATEKWRDDEAKQLTAAWWMFVELAESQVAPEGLVLVPKLSANYLFNQVPELGFANKDEKDTVLYHLNYMASEFSDSAKQFVKLDHEKQMEFKDLYKRAVLNARKFKSTLNWVHVSDLGVGATRARNLCRELGIDPESNNLHAPYNKENQK